MENLFKVGSFRRHTANNRDIEFLAKSLVKPMVIHRLWRWPMLLAGLWLGSSSVAMAQTQPLSQQDVAAVVGHLTRTMDTTAQAARNPRYVGVTLTTCPVQVSGQEGVYIYQEQTLVEAPDSPYRQRFLQIALSADATRVESRTFKPTMPDVRTGICQRAEPTVDAEALGNMVCVVALRPAPLGYVGSTPSDGCPVNLQGAVRLTNTIVLHRDGMDTWDRGYNDQGVQVWGARAEPYRYRWVE